LTLHDYAKEAFCIDTEMQSDTGYSQGGIYAGDRSPYAAPGDKPMPASARLVAVAPGKVFVRWVDRRFQGQPWQKAAEGAWWMTDNIADRVVQTTARKYGAFGDSGIIARHFGNVGYTWSDDEHASLPYAGKPGTYKSDMSYVVACRTTRLIKVLVGVGRPVVNQTLLDPAVPSGRIEPVKVDSGELQIVMLTTIRSPKDPNRSRFIGDQFLDNVFFGPSNEFTHAWLRAGIVQGRRARTSAARRGL
jgi:hypothetical protein